MTAPELNADLQAFDRTFQVIGLHAPGEVAEHYVDATTAVVLVDIIRCTTTTSAVVAARASYLRVLVKRSDDSLDDLVADHEALGLRARLVIGGEKNGVAIPGGSFGNSVLEVPADLTDAGVGFFSTNAGRAVEVVTRIVRPGSGTGVFLSSMRNLPVLAQTIADRGYTRLVIASGGFYSRISLEDAVAGGRLIRLLGYPESALDDGALSMVAIADRYQDDAELIEVLHRNRIGKALTHYGRAADIPAAIVGEGIEPTLHEAMTHSVGQLGWLEDTPVFLDISDSKETSCSISA